MPPIMYNNPAKIANCKILRGFPAKFSWYTLCLIGRRLLCENTIAPLGISRFTKNKGRGRGILRIGGVEKREVRRGKSYQVTCCRILGLDAGGWNQRHRVSRRCIWKIRRPRSVEGALEVGHGPHGCGEWFLILQVRFFFCRASRSPVAVSCSCLEF